MRTLHLFRDHVHLRIWKTLVQTTSLVREASEEKRNRKSTAPAHVSKSKESFFKTRRINPPKYYLKSTDMDVDTLLDKKGRGL